MLCDTENTYIVSEFCNGGDLEQILESENNISEETAIRVIREICAGYREILTCGYIHRDLKPANIFIHDE